MENPAQDAVRVTLKQVAEAAKVHYSTVSKALKGTGRIPAPTRDRIRRIAEQIGYQHDPVLQSLAAQRHSLSRESRAPRIVFLTNRWLTGDPTGAGMVRLLADGVRRQTETTGCIFDLLAVDDGKLDSVAIARQCDPARTDGVVVGAWDALSPRVELDWPRYSLVKIDSAFMLPADTLVASDRMQIARLAFHNAHRLGYRRIGIAVSESEEEATQSLYSAGYYVAQEELSAPGIPILSFREKRDAPETIANRIVEWAINNRLQIVLGGSEAVRGMLRVGGLAVPQEIAFANLCINEPDPAVAGVVQHHGVVGQKAAEALALLIMCRKQGLNQPSVATYVGGTWQDGATAPPCGPSAS